MLKVPSQSCNKHCPSIEATVWKLMSHANVTYFEISGVGMLNSGQFDAR
jgi:hypothetical protein